jgi:hypothetical protein
MSNETNKPIDENDPKNIKIAHQIRWDATDSDLLFYQQIGMRWVQMSWGRERPDLDQMRQLQERLLQYDIQIYSGRHDAYHSLKIQLGQPGRDEDIETPSSSTPSYPLQKKPMSHSPFTPMTHP